MKSLLATLSLFGIVYGHLLGADGPNQAPDFTQGDAIPADAKHDWNLGPTGLRGWIHTNGFVTREARQIAVTKVHPGSPADGIFQVGDVILGVGGKPFAHDPRTEFGKAITAAEAADGNLTLTRWRGGNTGDIAVKLQPLGPYGLTAPYNCPKSKRILDDGCKALAERMKVSGYGTQMDPIPRSLNALALLASGEKQYLPLIRREVEWAAAYKADDFQAWHYTYLIMLLAEHRIATGDASGMAGLRRLALEAAKGQSAVGSWGHRFAKPDGRRRQTRSHSHSVTASSKLIKKSHQPTP